MRIGSILLLSPFLVFDTGTWGQGEVVTDWSGEIEYAVSAVEAPADRWDFLPQSLTLQTDGSHFRMIESGTDFERIWLVNGEDVHILFHFLGHAVELLESCPTGNITSSFPTTNEQHVVAGHTTQLVQCVTGPALEAQDLGSAPCIWPTARMPLECTLADGKARYQITAISVRSIPRKQWKRRHFDLPSGYEPVDRPTLSTLISSMPRE